MCTMSKELLSQYGIFQLIPAWNSQKIKLSLSNYLQYIEKKIIHLLDFKNIPGFRINH